MNGSNIIKPGNIFFLLALALSLLLSLSACDKSEDTKPQKPAVQSVTVTTVKSINVAETVERVAQTKATEEIELVARVEGYLLEQKFIEGSDVNKGDLLFVIEKAPYEAEVQRTSAEVEKAKANHTKTQLDLDRIQILRNKNTISQAELDKALAEEKMAAADILMQKANLRKARIDLSYTEIRSPINGRIGRSGFSEGDLVNRQSAPLATIVSLDPISVYWEVSEGIPLAYRKRMQIMVDGKLNMKVIPRLRFADGSIYDQEGTVDFIDNRVNPETGTQRVRAVFPNPDKILVPGQYVTIIIQIGESEERLVIPQSAVQANQSGYFLLVVDDNNVAAIKPVKLGDRHGVNWIVEEGLNEGETIIYQGIQKVRPGSVVNPVHKDSP
ncbi:MAG: efflux transporter periplasmic adaptor subunit [Gammaproteobacteria bacterium]|nr:MAG: efflux transporter periplasmic adaptor subunit [Gammaproteobacteria bacterium]